jgi:TRAP-type C4-dicarboxylate transport system permease small subunit
MVADTVDEDRQAPIERPMSEEIPLSFEPSPIDARRNRPFARLVVRLDRLFEALSTLFLFAANACLFLMLVGTALTILLRPLNVSFYWLWPWTMQVFVWMTFLGFFVVYRKGKDIAVDFVMRKLGPGAMRASRWFVIIVVLLVIGVILKEMPIILESQVGVIDGVVTPWGVELERYSLSLPLAASCLLIFLHALLDGAKAWLGWPEPESHILADE